MKKSFWDRTAKIDDRVMRKDHKAYKQMYSLIYPVVRHRQVLELVTGAGLIARHIGGKKQRISIACAIMKDAPILRIAHRLKTVRHAGNILVIDGGKIVQRGAHGERMEQGGIYRRFAESRELAIG